MKKAVWIQTLQEADRVIKQMKLYDSEPGEEMRQAARLAYKNVIEDRMNHYVDEQLEKLERTDGYDRRNGHYKRHLLTALGDIELMVPRTRTFSACRVVEAYARRTQDIEKVILAGFVLGLSTRKVGKVLLHLTGEKVSPSTVSRVARVLDEAVRLFHQRPLQDRYQALLFDGVVLSRKTGAGAVKRPVLVALGILPDGRKEVIDYALAASESEQAWLRFLEDLYRRGLEGKGLKIIVVDGGRGLLNALDTVYPGIPVQRCWAHRIRNFENKSRVGDWKEMKKGLHRIMNAKNDKQARSAARQFAKRWQQRYPQIVDGLRKTLDDLLVFFMFQEERWRKMSRTTNAIERRFREVRRRTRPMGVLANRTSMDRILYAIFRNENSNQQASSPFLILTQNT